MDHYDNFDEDDDFQYKRIEDIDFSILQFGFKRLPFFEDDLYLGMQALNVGLVDSFITRLEKDLREEWFDTEKVPIEKAAMVSAFSQMWIFNLYEVLRIWKNRKEQFQKLFDNGGIESKLSNMEKINELNITIETRMKQLQRFNNDTYFRFQI